MRGMTSLTDRGAAHRMTRDEFELWREGIDDRVDRNRYELLEGEVLVTPSPSTRHQIAVGELHLALRQACPEGMRVLLAPFDVVLPGGEHDTTLQPDLLLTRDADLGEQDLEGAPVLVVEVLSPTTWHRDLGPKLEAYARAGVEHYWVMAPKIPSLTVHRLGTDGHYREVTHVEGSTEVSLVEPMPVRIVPAELIR